MAHILNHFSLQAAKWNSLVLMALIVVWVGVLTCVISSILSQPFDRKQRIFWIGIVMIVPFLGVLSYLPFSFRKEDLPHIFLKRKKRSKKGPKSEDDTES
jgi:MFS-type transporter involved in bile tolerance (Atg22 family)